MGGCSPVPELSRVAAGKEGSRALSGARTANQARKAWPPQRQVLANSKHLENRVSSTLEMCPTPPVLLKGGALQFQYPAGSVSARYSRLCFLSLRMATFTRPNHFCTERPRLYVLQPVDAKANIFCYEPDVAPAHHPRPSNTYVEALLLNVAVLEGGPFGG